MVFFHYLRKLLLNFCSIKFQTCGTTSKCRQSVVSFFHFIPGETSLTYRYETRYRTATIMEEDALSQPSAVGQSHSLLSSLACVGCSLDSNLVLSDPFVSPLAVATDRSLHTLSESPCGSLVVYVIPESSTLLPQVQNLRRDDPMTVVALISRKFISENKRLESYRTKNKYDIFEKKIIGQLTPFAGAPTGRGRVRRPAADGPAARGRRDEGGQDAGPSAGRRRAAGDGGAAGDVVQPPRHHGRPRRQGATEPREPAKQS